MIGDDYRVCTQAGNTFGIGRMQHTFDNQFAWPFSPDLLERGPIEDGFSHASHERGQRQTPLGSSRGSLDIHHAWRAGQQRLQTPSGVPQKVQQHRWTRAKWQCKTVAQVAQASAGIVGIHSNNQHLDTGLLRPLHKMGGDAWVRAQVDLEPRMALRKFGDALQRCAAGGGKAVGNLRLPCCPREFFVGVGPCEAAQSHRCHTEGRAVGMPQKLRVQSTVTAEVEYSRHQPYTAPHLKVALHRGFVTSPALNEVVNQFGQPRLGALLQVKNSQHGKCTFCRDTLHIGRGFYAWLLRRTSVLSIGGEGRRTPKGDIS